MGETDVVEARLERRRGDGVGRELARAVAEGVVDAERAGRVGDGRGLRVLRGYEAVRRVLRARPSAWWATGGGFAGRGPWERERERNARRRAPISRAGSAAASPPATDRVESCA
jgi:hypothetical protein